MPMVEKCVASVEISSVMLLLEIEEDSIVRKPYEMVVVGIQGLIEIFGGKHVEIWVLGMGYPYILSQDLVHEG